MHTTNWQILFYLLKFIMLTIKVNPELWIFASERKATQNLLVWCNSATHAGLCINSWVKELSVWSEWQAGNIVKFQAYGKVINPKHSKHWQSTVAHTIECVCSKILNHGLNHGKLLFSLFRFFEWKNILY